MLVNACGFLPLILGIKVIVHVFTTRPMGRFCHTRQRSESDYLLAAIALLATIGFLYRALVDFDFVLIRHSYDQQQNYYSNFVDGKRF